MALCSALVLAACGSATKDWANASAQNTVAAYQSFLAKHPGDTHAPDARMYLSGLQDESAWKTAQSGNSLESYRQYLQSQPTGMHSQDARDHVTGLERADAWKSAQLGGSQATLEAFLQKYPQGAEADQARQKLAMLKSDYRDRLGVFHDEQAAERRRKELQSRFGAVLKEIDVVSPDASNKRYRLMSGLMDRQDAETTCTSLNRNHQTCEVVKAAEQHG
jgi:hypothetical protein